MEFLTSVKAELRTDLDTSKVFGGKGWIYLKNNLMKSLMIQVNKHSTN